MKRIPVTLLAVIVVIGLFGVGGYAQRMHTTFNGDATRPGLRGFEEVGRHGIMAGHDFGFGGEFPPGLVSGGVPMMAFGFFLPAARTIILLTLLALFIYWRFTRSGCA